MEGGSNDEISKLSSDRSEAKEAIGIELKHGCTIKQEQIEEAPLEESGDK